MASVRGAAVSEWACATGMTIVRDAERSAGEDPFKVINAESRGVVRATDRCW